MTIANPTQGVDRRVSEASERGSSLASRLAVARRALQLILAVAIIGVGFSGVLTYRELAEPAAAQCSALGEPGTIFGQPPCVYGLIMYSVIVLVAGLALVGSGRKRTDAEHR